MNLLTHEVFMKNVAMNGMLKVFAAATVFVSLSAFGGTKDSGAMEYLPKGSAKCTQPEYVDSTFSILVRGIDKAGAPIVNVNIPRGETEVDRYELKCPRQNGAVEFAITCDLTTPEGTFNIWVGSPGDSSLNARITPIDGKGNYGEAVWLSCKRGFHNPIGKN